MVLLTESYAQPEAGHGDECRAAQSAGPDSGVIQRVFPVPGG